jgi:dienelactone hydrolase
VKKAAEESNRRRFLQRFAAGAGVLAAAPIGKVWAGSRASGLESSTSRATPEPADESTNLLTDPRFQVGANFRVKQFIQKGADPKEAAAIFGSLPNLDPQPWVDAWSRAAQPHEQRAVDLEKQGKMSEASQAFEKASFYYGIAKFPVINHPAKQAAYKKCIETYLKAARYFDPPLERVTIPFEGREIVGYLRLPKGIKKPGVVIATGGVDVYKEERDTSDLLSVGLAAFNTDMPGNGECPIWYTPDAGRFYSAIIDYLLKRDDLDGTRLGIIGRSYGGYWGGKMAYVESKRIKAAVQWGGPTHYTFQEAWLQHLKEDKLYLWSLLDSMMYANHVNNFDELLQQAPTMSLKSEGWMDKPAAPILAINGARDGWISIQDLYILLESGDPKAARVYPEGGHMGGDPGTGSLAMAWLKGKLG